MIAAAALILALNSAESECRQHFGSACSEAVGRWLPGNRLTRWTSTGTHTTQVRFVSGFVNRGKTVPHSWGVNAIGGTKFVYGVAGPTQGYGLYDSANRLTFYEQGCCAWHEIVLASTVSAPPMQFKHADLRSVRTTRGAALGMTVAQIRSRYGYAKLLTVAGSSGLSELRYTVSAPYPRLPKSCEQDDIFAFRGGKAVIIVILEGC